MFEAQNKAFPQRYAEWKPLYTSIIVSVPAVETTEFINDV